MCKILEETKLFPVKSSQEVQKRAQGAGDVNLMLDFILFLQLLFIVLCL